MWLLKLAWKNLWRNRGRTVITMAAIFFAVIFSVVADSLTRGVFENLVKNMVSYYTGYIQVHQKGYWDDQVLDNSFRNENTLLKSILQEQNISGVAPRIESFALASSETVTKGCMVAGIDPQQENEVTSLAKKLTTGEYLAIGDHAVLLGEGLAKRLQLKVRDTIVLIGQGYHGALAAGKYPVKGLVKFGTPGLNDKVLFLPLPAAQEFYAAEEMVSSYVISLKDPGELDKTANALSAKLQNGYEVMTWGEMLPEIKQHIQSDTNSMKYILGFLYVLICFGIFGTLLMMMVERRLEMGMLVAIGMKKGKLGLLLVMELVLTVVAGCLSGLLVSIPVVYYLKENPIRFGSETAAAYERFGFEAIIPASVEPDIFIKQGIIVLIAGLILSLYPLYKVLRLDAVQAMKR